VERYRYLQRIESSARTYASQHEVLFKQAKGAWLTTSEGRQVFDCLACAGALPLGHNHPEVVQAALDHLSSNVAQQVLDFSTPQKYEFVTTLFSLLPKEFAKKAKILFCSPSGSDAVEAALKLARYATQRRPIIAFHGAYHGMTSGALGAMGNLHAKAGPAALGGDVHFAPYPYNYRCPFGSNGDQTDALSIRYLETLLSDPESGISKPAAVILEVVQGEGGAIPASDAWLRSVRELTKKYDIPLIIDEVQTGFGRTGTLFAFERAGVIPDILVLSKALGGGFPLAAIVYNEVLDLWPKGMHAGTFRGNQIAMVAGKVTMDIIQREQLSQHAQQLGEQLISQLRELARNYPQIGDIRGRGLMIGIEIIDPTTGSQTPPADGKVAKAVKSAAFDLGLLVETGGRNGSVLRLLPPLNITSSDVDIILDTLAEAFSKTLRKPETICAA
jgi:2,4-diaminobutyrate 4-transaminase